MLLPNKSTRDSQGIDSFERAIVYSALLLRQGYFLSEDRSTKDAIQIALSLSGSGENILQNINIRANLLVVNESLLNGGNILSNLQERMQGTVDYLGANINPSLANFLPIIPEPPTVQTLEQYFYWGCQQLLAEDVSNYRRLSLLPIFKGNNNPFTMDCIVSIPFDYRTYLESNNLLGAIGVGESGGDDDDLPFGDEVQLNDNYQLKD